MTTAASLSQDELVVEPGVPAHLDVTVRNEGAVVDRFCVVPRGIPDDWVSTEPAELPLFPAAEGVLRVTITPPRLPEVEPGPRTFALMVCSQEDPEGSVVEEGLLEVLPFTAPGTELSPRLSSARGRGAGRHRLAVDNRGNAALEVRVSGSDRDGTLAVSASPGVLVVPPGSAAFAAVRARARKAFWRGPERTVPFVLQVQPAEGEPLPVEATFVQQPLLPRWLPKALAAATALAVLAALLWQGVLKPAVRDEARAAAAERVAPVEEEVARQQAAVSDLQSGAGQAPAPPGGPPPAAPTPAPAPSFVDPGLGDPRSARLELRPGRQSATSEFGPVVFSLTDLVLSNPRGHSGLLTLRRSDDVLLQTDLANFRDLDYHFVSPLVFGEGETLRAEVTCTEPAGACEAAVFVSGYARPASDG